MHISDWRSDVCSSDLDAEVRNQGWFVPRRPARPARRAGAPVGTIRAPGTTVVSMGVPAASARHLRRAFAIDGVTHRKPVSETDLMEASLADRSPAQNGRTPCRERGWTEV